MKRLFAVNEKVAIYQQNDSSLEKPVNTRKYLSDLLKIRTAETLVKFLRDYPHDLGPAMGEEELGLFASEAAAPKGDFMFSQSALINAASKYNVEYFDALVSYEADGSMDQADSLCLVEIEKLERLAAQIRRVLNMALTYYGRGTCESMFSREEREGFALLSISREDVDSMLPDSFSRFANYLDTLSPDIVRVGSTVTLPLSDGQYFFKTDGDCGQGIREAAGIITSLVLTRWLDHFGTPTRVQCTADGGLVLRDSEIREIPMELARIVIERRIGTCDFCGRPYIVIRVDKSEQPSNHYCCSSCSVQDSRQRQNQG